MPYTLCLIPYTVNFTREQLLIQKFFVHSKLFVEATFLSCLLRKPELLTFAPKGAKELCSTNLLCKAKKDSRALTFGEGEIPLHIYLQSYALYVHVRSFTFALVPLSPAPSVKG